MRDTRDMAREVGIELDLIDEDEGQINWYITTEGMKAFEALARADEREGCAALCDQLSDSSRDLRFGTAIRART